MKVDENRSTTKRKWPWEQDQISRPIHGTHYCSIDDVAADGCNAPTLFTVERYLPDMAAGQSRLTHFTGDTSAVIDADIWTYYVRLRQFGQVLEALKDKCAAYIRHREPVRERLIEIAKSDHALFQSWITEAHPRITWKLGTPLIGGSRNGFRIAIEWTEAQVAVLEDESEIRLNYLDSDIPFSALTGHWKAVWKIDIFERDMRDLAHNWLKAQLMFP